MSAPQDLKYLKYNGDYYYMAVPDPRKAQLYDKILAEGLKKRSISKKTYSNKLWIAMINPENKWVVTNGDLIIYAKDEKSAKRYADHQNYFEEI